MIEGLWTVQFHGPKGTGGGVVVLTKGQVLGGDSGFVYIGTYELRGDGLKASVLVKNFDAAVPNVLGIPGDFDLVVEGEVKGNAISGTAYLAEAPDAKMVVRLTKSTDLR